MMQWTEYYHSYAALWIFAFFSAGIFFSGYLLNFIDFAILLIILAVIILAAVVCHILYPPMLHRLMFIFLFFAGIGAGYNALARFPDTHLVLQGNSNIEQFRGWISETHYRADGRHHYVLECDSIYTAEIVKPAESRIFINQGQFDKKLNYGDVVKLDGFPERPWLPGNPGEFNYRKYLQMKNIYFRFTLSDENVKILDEKKGNIVNRALFDPLRQYLLKKIDFNLDSPAREVTKALLLGERQDIDDSVMEDFQKSGVIHVLAISGLHVGFILMLFLLFFSFLRLPYFLRILFSLFFLFLFVALIDFKAPVVRASVMAAFYFIGKLSERFPKPLNLIGVAGLTILLFEPRQLFQPGFQFSFTAVGAILYGYPRLKRMIPWPFSDSGWRGFINKFIRTPLIVSLAAVLGTAPLTWLYYGSLQTGAIIANIFVIPMIGSYVILSLLFLILSVLIPGIMIGFSYLLKEYVKFILDTVGLFADQAFVQIYLPHPSMWIIMLCIAAFFLIFNMRKRVNRWYLVFVLITLLFYVNGWLLRNEQNLSVIFADVGQGDAAVIRIPGGETIVVDSGDMAKGRDKGKEIVLPLLRYYGIGTIKYLIGTHPHSDHIGGFRSLMQSVSVDTLVLSGFKEDSKFYHFMIHSAKKNSVPIRYVHSGQVLYVNPVCRIYILHPDNHFLEGVGQNNGKVNNSSIVLKIVYGATSFLLTGDLERDGETALARFSDFLDADVLKVGHHGSKTSSQDEFLNLVTPGFGVISVGRHNRFYHPSRSTVTRLIDHSVIPLRTDHFGAIVFESDGREIYLRNWRE